MAGKPTGPMSRGLDQSSIPSDPLELTDHVGESGSSPFEKWFNALDQTAAARVVLGLERLSGGNVSNVKAVGEGILENVAAAASGPKIFQLYTRGDDAFFDDHVRRAIDCGYDAFCITVDSAIYSRRERDIANRYDKPWRGKTPGMRYQAAFSWDQVRRFIRCGGSRAGTISS